MPLDNSATEICMELGIMGVLTGACQTERHAVCSRLFSVLDKLTLTFNKALMHFNPALLNIYL